jgi:hypothetical protein
MNEKNQARLRLMSIFLTSVGMSVNEFYAIGIQGTIALQGKYSYELASKLHKYSGIVTEQGYVRFQVSKHIYVTLT